MTDFQQLSEYDLVVQLKRGDQRAGDELYRRYGDAVERYCYHLSHDSEIARDALQDAFLAAITRIKDLREEVSFKAWLFRIARNSCLMIARRSSHQLRLEDADDVWETSTPLTKTLEGELSGLLQSALARLRPIYREALVLREFESLTYREIAEATGSSIASVKFRLHKARKALALSLGEYLDERKKR